MRFLRLTLYLGIQGGEACQASSCHLTISNGLRLVRHQLVVGLDEQPLNGLGVQCGCLATLRLAEFPVALPDSTAVLVGGVPNL